MKQIIDNFSKEYAFLSNFYPSEVEFDGVIYPTVEHAFQAAKTLNPTEREMVLLAKTPGQAKRVGRTVTLIDDWDDIKFSVMYDLVRQKFNNIVELKNKLIATGTEILVEGNTWGDTYWGICRGIGENKLGEILMRVRIKLK
jgi:N-glycosidase YbiA